jgi:hypothetical protein
MATTMLNTTNAPKIDQPAKVGCGPDRPVEYQSTRASGSNF